MEIKKYAVGKTVAEVFGISLPCGGKGKCGGCRVSVRGELSVPDETERAILGDTADGFRLACRAVCMGEVVLTSEMYTVVAITDKYDSYGATSPISTGKFGAAVDIGTTTLAAKLIETHTGRVVSTATAPNPQSHYGADVTTRMEYAVNGGADELRGLVADAVNGLLRKLTREPIDTAVMVGNTAMLSLLSGVDVVGMTAAPFVPKSRFGNFFDAKEILGECLAKRLYLAPCVSAFVGADTVAASLSCNIHRHGSTLLCDIGTNGELVFAKEGKITCASTAAGPALEGAEISCGMTAGRGAVDRVRITDGHLSVSTIENAPAIGICGSGLISAAAALLDLGVLEPSGYLEAPFKISEGVTLLPADIRKLQAAKAAIHAGIEILTRESIPDRVVIAGGFGHYLDIGDCIRIGLLPEWVHGRTVSVGNAALTGACMMLQNSELIEEAESFAKAAELCELDLCGEFPDKYVESMIFSNEE